MALCLAVHPLSLPFSHSLFQVCFFHISLENKNQTPFFFLTEGKPYFLSCSSLISPFLKLLECSFNVRWTCPGSVPSSCSPRLGWFTAAPLGPKLRQLPSMLCKSSRTFGGPSKGHSPQGPDAVSNKRWGRGKYDCIWFRKLSSLSVFGIR